MGSQFNDQVNGVALGRLLMGQPITQRDFEELIKDKHGQFARYGTRHNLFDFPSFFETDSLTYTSTNDVVDGEDLDETTPFVKLKKKWINNAGLERIGLVLAVFGRRFDFKAELRAVDGDAFISSMTATRGDIGYGWSFAQLILSSEKAHEGDFDANPHRGIILPCTCKSNFSTAQVGNAFLYAYQVDSSDV